MPTDSTTYGAVISRNVVAARARTGLKQSEVAARMRALGYSWHPQTVGEVEKGNRRVVAEEILGLSLALGTSMGVLLGPAPDDLLIALPAGQQIDRMTVLHSIGRTAAAVVRWEGNEPHFAPIEPSTSLATPESIAAHQGPFVEPGETQERDTWPNPPRGAGR